MTIRTEALSQTNMAAKIMIDDIEIGWIAIPAGISYTEAMEYVKPYLCQGQKIAGFYSFTYSEGMA